MSSQLIRAVLLALLAALLALPVGYFVAHWAGWAVFCCGLGLQLAFHFRNFARLERWSRSPVVDSSLEGEGAWDGVFGRLYRHEKDLRTKLAQRDHEISMLIAAGQALTDGVVLLDANNLILFCNTTAEMQLGLVIRTDRGQPVVNLVRQPEFVNYLGSNDFSRPLTLRTERSEDRVLSIFVIPYAGDRRLMQIKDVTQTDLLDRMRRDFVANVSHELRTPLTVLAGFLETLQEIEVDRDEQARYLGMMIDQSRRMESIVQDLLTLSSIESAPPPESEIVDMANIVDKLRRDAEALSAGRHSIVIETDGQGDLRGSEPELVSAFGNLVANAVRYTPTGGTVRISWRANTQSAEFAVQDTGIGIDAKHIPRLTERFYRVDRGRSRDAGGTGLGLAIVKHSLNRHQAQLDIKSTPGVGSRFAARFPASRVVGV
ncbi:phosphate regulon sensor histidine kinase PhoR [Dechloromonas denitrificans]|uniref:phosphate regulon sensor histidine kinase PhoR n=1 Tax=Dechloromonas denitrificans TaxID=281362 RepID=UPI001CF87621|nr:phosphate regulon sensor histidine kinase PhoR [Dechloromonas denitrificans]UCV11150.1 phosphate regulon sensor histidine kinase PhoR [Dechloromonas denitrificans]